MTLNYIWWWGSSLGVWGTRNTSSLWLLSCSLWPGVLEPVWVGLLYSHMQYHNDTIIKDEQRLLYKYMYLSLYCKGSKRATQGLHVRGGWRPNRIAIYWPPLLWPSALWLSRSPGLLNRRPRGPTLLGDLLHLISNFSGSQLIGAPRPQGLMWLSLPHFVYNSDSNCNCNFCLDWVISNVHSVAHSIFGIACLIVIKWK